MKMTLLMQVKMLAVLALAGNVALAAPDTQAADATSCRKVMKGLDTQGQVYCGTVAQWAEFDRRVALNNAGVICRGVHTAGERCMTAVQWKQHDRRQRSLYAESPFSQTQGSSIGDPIAGAAREQMNENLQSHMQSLAMPEMPVR